MIKVNPYYKSSGILNRIFNPYKTITNNKLFKNEDFNQINFVSISSSVAI